MLDWLQQHVWVTLLAFMAVVIAIWKLGILQNVELVSQSYKERAKVSEENRQKADELCDDLREDLRRAVREKDLRDDINRQDRAMIRALKLRLLEHKIDCSDIEESIQRRFNAQ